MKKTITKILVFIILIIPVFQTKAWLAELEPQLNPWVWAFLKSFVSSNLWNLDFLKKIVEIINRDLNKYTPTQQIALTYFKLLIEENLNWGTNIPTLPWTNPITPWYTWTQVSKMKRWKQEHLNYWFKDFNTSRTITLTSMTEWALKSAIAWGWTIKIPAWTINISGQIMLNNNTKLIWAWMWKTILSYRWGWADWIIRLSWHTNVVLQGFTLDCNQVKAKSHWIWVIWAPSNNFLFKNVEVKNLWPKAKWPEKFDISESSWIMIWYNWWAHFTIDWCRILDVAQHSIGLHDNPTWYWVVKNNYIKWSFMGIDISSRVHDVELFNNEITDCLFWWKFAWSNRVYFHDNYIHDLYYFEYDDSGTKQKDAKTGFAYQWTNWDVEIKNNLFYWSFNHIVNKWSWSAQVSWNTVLQTPLK